MYSSLKNIQILVALLKKYGVKHIVISAGTRHTPFVYSVEHDDFFTTYSIVDERSASFFALGLIEKLRQPVAIVCTSGTAAANYVSAANEAFYQQLPLLLLTADRNHYYMFQQEEQMIPQEGLYSQVCKKVITLGHVRDEKDFWYCSRICNEALLELTQGEQGPVHINFIVENDYPITQGIVKFEEDKLPEVKRINRLTLEDDDVVWKEWANKLSQSKVLIIYGQKGILNEVEKNNIDTFTDKVNCVISKDLLSNFHQKYAISTFALSRVLSNSQVEELVPDIIITINANAISEMKGRFAPFKAKFEHWHISAKGAVSDPYKMLSDVIACSPNKFFEKMSSLLQEDSREHSYFDLWKNYYNTIGDNGLLNDVDLSYSSMYVTQQFIKSVPNGSLVHLANSNSVRLANFFDLDESIEVYDNRGAHGIDGSMSAFIGQASCKDGLAYLLIGDLSFFYDMNALWNHYVGNNVRIVVSNNSGGAIFYTYPNRRNVPTLGDHIAAEHHNSVRAWAEDRGFLYFSCRTKEEVAEALSVMSKESDKPILLEAFTDKEDDADSFTEILSPYRTGDKSIKHAIGQHLSPDMKKRIRKIVEKR